MYIELPRHILVYIYDYKKERGEDGSDLTLGSHMLIDKRTLEVQSVVIKNDFFGGIVFEGNPFHRGMYVANISSFELKRNFDTVLDENIGMTDAMRHKIEQMQMSLGDADNNVVFYGRLLP